MNNSNNNSNSGGGTNEFDRLLNEVQQGGNGGQIDDGQNTGEMDPLASTEVQPTQEDTAPAPTQDPFTTADNGTGFTLDEAPVAPQERIQAEATQAPVQPQGGEEVGTLRRIGRGVVQGAVDVVNDLGDVAEILPLVPEIPDIELYTDEELGTAGKVAKAITNYASVFVPVAGQVGKIGKLGKVSKAFIAGGLADFIAFDKEEGNLMSALNNVPGLEKYVPDLLAIDENDSQLEAKIKQTLEGGILGGAAMGIAKAVTSTAKFLRHTKDLKAAGKTTEEAVAVAAEKHLKDPEVLKPLTNLELDPNVGQFVAKDTRAVLKNVPDDKLVTELKDTIAKSIDIDAERLPGQINLKTFSGSKDTKTLMRATEEAFDKYFMENPAKFNLSEAQVKTLVRDTARSLDIKPGDLIEQAKLLSGSTEDLARQVTKLKVTTNVAALRASSLADEVLSTSGKLSDETKAMFMESLDNFYALGKAYRKTASNVSFGLKSFKQIPGLEEYLSNKEVLDTIVNRRGGEQGLKAIAKYLKIIGDNPAEAGKFLAGLGGRVKLTTNAIHHLWRRSILSGVGTHIWNISSSYLNNIYRPLLNIVGAGATFQGKALKRNLQTIIQQQHYMHDGFRYAMKVFKSADGTPLLNSSQAFKDTNINWMDPDLWAMSPNSPFAKLMKGVDAVSSAFSDRLLAAGDEFNKQMMFRGRSAARLAEEGAAQGLNGKQLQEFIDDGLDLLVSDKGNIRKLDGVLEAAEQAADEKGLIGEARKLFMRRHAERTLSNDTLEFIQKEANDLALEGSFQTPLGPGMKKFAELVQLVPGARYVFPFIKTPTNLIKQGLNQVPGAGAIWNSERRALLNETIRALRSGQEVSEAGLKLVGEQVMGTAIVTGAAALALSGKISGAGPSDKAERNLWLNMGYRPYSFHHETPDGKIVAVSYQRLDPYNFLFGAVADIVDLSKYRRDDDDINNLESLFWIAKEALVRNIGNKFYLRNLATILDAVNDTDGYSIKKVVNGYQRTVTPRLIAQLGLDGDNVLRETRNVLDGFIQDVPFLRKGLPPRYNALGEPITFGETYDIGGTFPLRTQIIDKDIVYKELFDMGYATQGMQRKMLVHAQGSTVDLTKIKNDKGDVAYDRYNELYSGVRIGNKTLRMALESEIKSKLYQSLPTTNGTDVKSPRRDRLSKIMSLYRARAKNELMKEFPQLKDERERIIRKKALLKRGLTDSQANEELKNRFGLTPLDDK